MKILADATLPHLDIAFPPPFEMTRYQSGDYLEPLLANKTILLCRSTFKLSTSLLDAAKTLAYIGTASSGRDHIDEALLAKHGIQLFDAQGSNALAVADYVMATLAFLAHYKGFKGKKAAIIGLGAVGSEVAKRLSAMDFKIIAYDPLKNLKDPTFQTASLAEVLDCSLICVHANLHTNLPHPSYHLIDEDFLRQLHPGAVIINASRGNIVDEKALLAQKNKVIYCTDVFSNEPDIDPAIIEHAMLCTPHIAGHSKEAKDNAIFLLSQKIHGALCLPMPSVSSVTPPPLPTVLLSPISKATLWETFILSLYNPQMESLSLKASLRSADPHTSLKNTFLKLRTAHQIRHDFCRYPLTADHFLETPATFHKRLTQLLGKKIALTEPTS